MAKITFKEYNQGHGVLFPLSIDSKIPDDHPVRLINEVVEQLDLRGVDFGYKGLKHQTGRFDAFYLLSERNIARRGRCLNILRQRCCLQIFRWRFAFEISIHF